MQDQSPKPPVPNDPNPDEQDQELLPDQGIWEQMALVSQEWQDAPVDESEVGVWKQTALANQEWQDAPVDENDVGVWEQTASANQEWQDAPVDESEAGVWEQSALVNQEWQDVAVDENESEVWDQTPLNDGEWVAPPVKDEEEEEKRKEGMIFLPKMVENLSYPLIPLIGYGFLGLSFFDHINILYPIKISEPVWIVETLGQITERIPTLWIGLLLVFFRREGYTRKWEVGVLKILSWLCLVLATIYLLMTPMLIGNTVRVYRLIDTQINAKATDQAEKIKRAKEQVSQTRDQDISNYLQYRNSPLPNLTPEQFKENLLQQADKSLSDLAVNTQALRDSQLGDLIKKTIKWTIGNLLSTFVCMWIWYLSRWTRIKNLELDSKG